MAEFCFGEFRSKGAVELFGYVVPEKDQHHNAPRRLRQGQMLKEELQIGSVSQPRCHIDIGISAEFVARIPNLNSFY